MNSLSGKKALIIGGSGGIGARIAKKLALCDVSLTVHGGHRSESFDRFVQGLSARTECKAKIHRFTVSDLPEIIPDTLKADITGADILCVCFGPFLQKPLHQMQPADWHSIVSLNYTLPGVIVSTALPAMCRRQWGRILLFGGTRTQAVSGFLTNAAYAGAKTAVCSLVKSTAAAYAPFNITCNALLPGFTETEYIPEQEKQRLAAKMPEEKLIHPDIIAETAVFALARREINGALLNVDCGWDPFFQIAGGTIMTDQYTASDI